LEGVFVFAAGFGSRVSALSLVSHWISDDTKATLYAAIAVLENLGHAVGDPTLQQIFATTLRLRFPPFWQALPFFVTAVSRTIFCLHYSTHGKAVPLFCGNFICNVYKIG
jgi:hypothetical protein